MKVIRSLLLFLIGAAMVSLVLMGYKYGGGTRFPNWDAIRLFRLTLFLSFSAAGVAAIAMGIRYVQGRREKRRPK